MKIVHVSCDDGWDGIYVDGELKTQGHGYGISWPAFEAMRNAGIDLRRGFSNYPDELGEWPARLEDIPDVEWDDS